ncbi:MAG: hypothetical protein GX902_03015 [Lentisphaerae bacterium]|jgi:hypothetical protein|nr:hypothetical protein [Lentisphaerota bacterium]
MPPHSIPSAITVDEEQRRRQIRLWLQQLERQSRPLGASRQRSATARSSRRRLLLFFSAGTILVVLSMLQEFFF